MAEDLPGENVIPSVGEPKIDYCLRCHTMAVQTAAIYAITSEASHVIGRYAICGECGWSPYEADQAWRERAEKAEQEVERLKVVETASIGAHALLDDAGEALARVRELAERWRHVSDRKSGPLRELLAALDDTEGIDRG